MSRYIDAEHLMQKLSRMIDFCEKHKVSGLNALFQVGDAIMDCPTADVVEVRHGRWVTLKRGRRLYCSRCEYPKPYKKLKTGYHIIDEGKYCPNCGAKMDGERKD